MGASQKPLKVQYDPDQVSFQSDKKFTQAVLFTSGIVLFACFIAANYITMKKQAKKKSSPNNAQIGKVSYTGKAQIGGDWALYDTRGNIFTHRNLQGKYYLIYFGFTLCPDVCPISLYKIAKALKKVRKSKEYNYFDIQAVFVSVDPDRDTNERIKQYCKIFDENMIGLTHKSNNNPQLKEVMKKFKIYSSKIYLSAQDQKQDQKNLNQNAPEVVEKMGQISTKKNDKYTLDHTIVTYLMGPSNQFLTYLGSNLNENQMAEIIIDQVSSDLSSKYIGKTEYKGDFSVNWGSTSSIIKNYPDTDLTLQLFADQIDRDYYIKHSYSIAIAIIVSVVILLSIIYYLICFCIQFKSTCCLPKSYAYTNSQKSIPSIILFVCGLFVFLSATSIIYFTFHINNAYYESQCVIQQVENKLDNPAMLKDSKWGGMRNLIRTNQNATKILQSHLSSSLAQNFLFSNSTQIVKNHSQTLNATLFHQLSVPFQSIQFPSPSNSSVLFKPDAFENLGVFYDSNEGTILGKLSSIKSSSIDLIHRIYNELTHSNQTISNYTKPLYSQLSSSSSSYHSFQATTSKLVKLATKNEKDISPYIDKSTIILYIIMACTIVQMVFTLVSVICLAFYHDQKRMALVQLSWILLGSVMIILCIAASVFTVIVISAGFPICNGYLALFEDQQKLINGSMNIDKQAGRVYNECLFSKSMGNIVEGLIVSPDNFTLTQYQSLRNATKSSSININDYIILKNDTVFIEVRKSLWFKFVDAYKHQVNFAINNTQYASERNPNKLLNSTYQFQQLNRMTNSKSPNTYQQNCTTTHLDDQIVEVQQRSCTGDYYTPPGFFTSQDYAPNKKRCLLMSAWTIDNIKSRYQNYFQNCKITNEQGQQMSLGDEIVRQYSNFYNYRQAIRSNYQKFYNGLLKYQTQFIAATSQIKDTFNKTNEYIDKIEPLIVSLENKSTGLFADKYQCEVIRQTLQMVYKSGCERLTPYGFTLMLLLWVCAIFVAVSVGMTVCFHRRAKVQ